MDQDFHYYGTYYAAKISGFSRDEATLIGKASNFIDFLHEKKYAGYWKLVRDIRKQEPTTKYQVIEGIDNPRYTFQGGLAGTGLSPEDGLWCSYHFMPGNYSDPSGSPSHTAVHGDDVANYLPGHIIRPVDAGITKKYHALLNRPQSALSRELIKDTIACASDNARLEAILCRAKGGWELLNQQDKIKNLATFRLILLGVRAHVIADTWAHQDWCGLSDKINTYWDVRGSSVGRQSIEYQEQEGDDWKQVVLSSMKHDNLKAVPNGTSYLGHGWMGHFPDYSFVKYRYKPCWRKSSDEPWVRNNPEQYLYAWVELTSLFSQARGNSLRLSSITGTLKSAKKAIEQPCVIDSKTTCPRKASSDAWVSNMFNSSGVVPPSTMIDAKQEPDKGTVLEGMLAESTSSTRYGTYYINASSDLYLFQIAADYHFHFVKDYLSKHEILEFTGSWSQKVGPLSPMITDLF